MKRFWFWALGATALHADDQTRINHPIENPPEPSFEFLYALERPQTLVVAENAQVLDLHQPLINYLRESGHNVTGRVGRVAIKSSDSSRWLFDTILVLGNALPKGANNNNLNDETLLQFLDTNWLLPQPSLPDHMRLPPSVAVFAGGKCDCPSQEKCSPISDGVKEFVKQIGFKPVEKGNSVCLNEVPVETVQGDSLVYSGGQHRYYPNNNLITPLLRSDNNRSAIAVEPSITASVTFIDSLDAKLTNQDPLQSLVSFFQAERSWSRAVYSSSRDLCTQ
eukprot:Protomagalhaensia_sp_Gyna_25__1214@NODE_1601_length_1699_cov_6_116265_g1307_i0_p1_GENE_NODE_1601_length_1699_cov_6_116265_g1307_i0NODE_1601_length_1699_cov_6_116265_g1307_i0_p1_ORF_typecomplete_len288_score43_47DDOST_48kD/PF03345_14/8_6e07_NODE_1601_length_1699_cov_6_116265_g1307_i028864